MKAKTTDTSRSTKYLALYNKLDSFMKEKLGRDDGFSHTRMINELSRRDILFRRYESELKSFARLRNAIVHNRYPDKAVPIAEPHKYVVTRYEELINQVFNPPKALSIAINRRAIYTTTLDANAIDVMKTMNENRYTHVPVLKEDKMYGVFSENTVFSYIAENKIFIEEHAVISDFIDFIPIEKHKGEKFLFIERDTLVSDVEKMFRIEKKRHCRLAVVYITENGSPDEELLGMITSWDIAGV
ncbi:CBS domain-containing protein [Phosphitispora sp. TUW77]|uniref:CBS domain-containing protein n=1 Tax=Phosphitispora sp. TUW77 TaxID=3152361 RepID=UPI003AB12685